MDGEDEEGEEKGVPAAKEQAVPPAFSFDVDSGIPLPCNCKTPLSRTNCLQQLTPKWGNGKVFKVLVEQVNNLEVSFM